MKLIAQVTTGWEDDPEARFAAARLHAAAEKAEKAEGTYEETLAKELQTLPAGDAISGLEQLFRRQTDAFKPIKKFAGALVAIPGEKAAIQTDALMCRMDVFAYAFLKGAKNFDLFMPLAHEANAAFRKLHGTWKKVLASLEDFERLGVTPPDEPRIDTGQYLELRKVISRPSARDERRSLATLLISGPSMLAEISEDLGLNYPLGQRTVGVFEHIGVIDRREGPGDPVFAIAPSALAATVFCLREKMGLDLLSDLPSDD